MRLNKSTGRDNRKTGYSTKSVRSVRGAVCISENTKEAITDGVLTLVQRLIASNSLRQSELIHLVFSVTRDLDNENPARAVRTGLGLVSVPLFCCVEPDYPGSLSRTVRVLLTCRHHKRLKPVYLNGAEVLRPDIRGLQE